MSILKAVGLALVSVVFGYAAKSAALDLAPASSLVFTTTCAGLGGGIGAAIALFLGRQSKTR